jgi:hypothetical protein
MTTIPLKTQQQIQNSFDYASQNAIQHYHWVPPEWADLPAGSKLEDNVADYDQNKFQPFSGYKEAGEFVKARRSAPVEGEPTDDPEEPHGHPKKPRHQWSWPKPIADTTHVDPIKTDEDGDPVPEDELKRLQDHLEQASQPKHAKYVKELRRILGGESLGMKRLSLMFEWTLLRATITLNDIDRALDNQSLLDVDLPANATQTEKYEAARQNYLSVLRDLDDHEPEIKRDRLNPDQSAPVTPANGKLGRKSGYGRSLKWFYIAPVIFGGRIRAARIIVHWNPHSSSLGVPIQH